MAEALGVAASGIAVAQIAVQVGGAVIKLKQLWDEVKDVPDDVADLMDQIDCLDPVLWEAENSFNGSGLPSTFWDDLASRSTTTYCRKALRNLTTIVDDLNNQITNVKKGRRRITAVKVLLQKDLIQKLEKRLENAVRMLMLAQQSYLVALQRVQPDVIIQKFNALTFPQSQPESQVGSDSTSETEVRRESKKHHEEPNTASITTKPRWVQSTRWTKPSYFGRICIESFASSRKIIFQSPLWLSRQSWELHSIKALGAWQWNLRSYRLIRRSSEICKSIEAGSLRDVQKLFEAGLASPYDRTGNGWTLRHYAVFYANFEMTKYLVDIGANPFEPDYFSNYPSTNINPSNLGTLGFIKQVISDTLLARKLLVYPHRNTGHVDQEKQLLSCNCRYGYEHHHIYMALLPYQCPSHRTQGLMRAARIDLYGDHLQEERHKEFNNYFTFAIDVIKGTPDVHITDPVMLREGGGKLTALLCAVFSAVISSVPFDRYYFHFDFSKFVASIRKWLEVLALAGVDLEAYGQREYGFLIGSCNLRHIELFWDDFGPEPEDWGFYFNEPTDEFAGNFWNLVRDSPLNIPGAWVEDEDEAYDFF
ncbi:uncharacterized protein F4812DRAFT_453064 [Daldinia caldariorum]|uniref:uncharacterized protein n=1 Tax=Daldinia caldariorum TaxID=326644 RepID=UPI002008CB6F|nr:uncharacterized protein F4812DRAFT_453064 [Daldinia caldariorum]KAI1464187.1 hypothetical protein F4812DRAFT_453064 [Daldinia caldariorum]